MALQLLEKNVHEKQDTIVGLRRQLEEMKTANMKMTAQNKVSVPSNVSAPLLCTLETYSTLCP